MSFRNSFKILLSFCLFGTALAVLPTSESLSVPPSRVSASIAATAYVIEPVGLLELSDGTRDSDYLLYSPRSCQTICTIQPIAAANSSIVDASSRLVSVSDLPANQIRLPLNAQGTSGVAGYLVTIVPTEN